MTTTDNPAPAARQVRVDVEAMAACLARQPDIVVAYLFGSTARGQTDALSDVDVAVLFDAQLEVEEMVERQLRLMVDLEEYTDREVQVVALNRASPLLAYQVVRHGIQLYEHSRAERIDFEVYTRKVYFDLKPRLDYHTRSLFDDIKEVGLSGRRKRSGSALEAARRIHQRLSGVTYES